jgi:hypothetical protein
VSAVAPSVADKSECQAHGHVRIRLPVYCGGRTVFVGGGRI